MPVGENADENKDAYYALGLSALNQAGVPFLVGGGFALFSYLGRWRTTKDIDLFVERRAVGATLAALSAVGFECELTDSRWLAKARKDGALIDIIFCSYNGLFPVDEQWIQNGRAALVLDVAVRVVGPEEMIVSKCFVAARDRFDGADIAWLLHALGPHLDWARIETMMRDHWQVLLWQLVHFFYVFPADVALVPRPVMARLLARQRKHLASAPAPATCRGGMLDPKLYRQQPEWATDLDFVPVLEPWLAVEEG